MSKYIESDVFFDILGAINENMPEIIISKINKYYPAAVKLDITVVEDIDMTIETLLEMNKRKDRFLNIAYPVCETLKKYSGNVDHDGIVVPIIVNIIGDVVLKINPDFEEPTFEFTLFEIYIIQRIMINETLSNLFKDNYNSVESIVIDACNSIFPIHKKDFDIMEKLKGFLIYCVYKNIDNLKEYSLLYK